MLSAYDPKIWYDILVVNRTFGSVRRQTRCRIVRFGSVRPIFSDFYLVVRFGLPNSAAKSEPNSSVSSVRPNFKIGKVRFGSVRFDTKILGSIHHYVPLIPCKIAFKYSFYFKFTTLSLIHI